MGGGRKHVRATGCRPVRSTVSWRTTDTAPYSFVPGDAKKRSATSRCTITHQRFTVGSAASPSDDDRRRHVIGEVGDELARRGVELGVHELERIAEGELDMLPPAEPLAERRLEASVELNGVHVLDLVGEVSRQHSEARPDLEDDVVRLELGQPPDHAENVLVHEPVLSERTFRPDGHGREKRVAALLSICCPSESASSPRASARATTVCTTNPGSFRLPRTGCGAR